MCWWSEALPEGLKPPSPPHDLGARYVNTDYLFVDDTDVLDIWRAFVSARDKYRHNYDIGQLVDTRERRQIVGDYSLTPMDIYLRRTFPDTNCIVRRSADRRGQKRQRASMSASGAINGSQAGCKRQVTTHKPHLNPSYSPRIPLVFEIRGGYEGNTRGLGGDYYGLLRDYGSAGLQH